MKRTPNYRESSILPLKTNYYSMKGEKYLKLSHLYQKKHPAKPKSQGV